MHSRANPTTFLAASLSTFTPPVYRNSMRRSEFASQVSTTSTTTTTYHYYYYYHSLRFLPLSIPCTTCFFLTIPLNSPLFHRFSMPLPSTRDIVIRHYHPFPRDTVLFCNRGIRRRPQHSISQKDLLRWLYDYCEVDDNHTAVSNNEIMSCRTEEIFGVFVLLRRLRAFIL